MERQVLTMRKFRYVFAGCLAAVLILFISALPFGISAIMDRTNQNKSHLHDMDAIQLYLHADATVLSPFQKLRLVGQGTGSGVPKTEATHTPEEIEKFVMDELKRYADAGLLTGNANSFVMITCAPELYYNFNNEQQQNIFWSVELGVPAQGQSLRLLMDDHSGCIYWVDSYCSEEAIVTKAKVEQLAAFFFGTLGIDYVVEDCFQMEDTTWYLSAVCSEGYQEVRVELSYSENGFSCTINS